MYEGVSQCVRAESYPSDAEIPMRRRVSQRTRSIGYRARVSSDTSEGARVGAVANLVLQHCVKRGNISRSSACEHTARLGDIDILDYRVGKGHVALGGVDVACAAIEHEVQGELTAKRNRQRPC